MRPAVSTFLCLLVSLVLDSEAAGQAFQGGIRGAVKDANGVIPGAAVTLTHEGTHAVRTTETNEIGEYVFANVAPGAYTLRASFTGFKPYEHSGIEIGVQRFVVLDIILSVGSFAESVTVTGETPVIETATASVAASLERVELETLPTPNRNPLFLSATTPNVMPSLLTQSTRQQDQNSQSLISVAGGPRRTSNYTLDGIPITDLRDRAVVVPSIEAIEEVKVQVSAYDAEMGRTSGGIFNTIYKTGSNGFRGSALVQNRPEWGTGQLYFAKQANEPKADSHYWLYAGSFGGPIARDKTFFWAATEGYRSSLTRNTLLTLPTPAMTRGDFSRAGVTIYDPLSTRPDPNRPGQFIRDPFPGNVIPSERLNAVGLKIAAFLLTPGQGDVSASANAVDSADQVSFNLNHRFSDKYSLSGTYMFYDSEEPGPKFFGGGPLDGGFVGRRVHLFGLNATVIPRDNTVYAFRYGYNSFNDDYVVPEYDVRELGFSENFLNQVQTRNFPSVSLAGYPGFGTGSPTKTRFYSHDVNVTGSKLYGSHTLKFGGEYRRLGVDAYVPLSGGGTFGFTSAFTAGPNPTSPAASTGDALASLLLGYPDSGRIDVVTSNDFFVNYYGAFIHDDWRVRSNIVLTLGLRIEHENGLREKDDAFTVGFDRERPWPVQPIPGMALRGGLMYAGVDGYPTEQGDPMTLKLGPRVGLTWSPNPRTSVRGGYGLFWVPYAYAVPSETTYGTRGFSAVTPYARSYDGGLTPSGSLSDPFPNGIEQPQQSSLGLLAGAGGDVYFVDQFGRSPYIHHFSADVQRELRPGVAVSFGYVGSRADRLPVSGTQQGGTQSGLVNINQVDPRFLSLGSALLDPVPNPFFGNPIFGSLSQSPSVPRAQLLRPHPQFGNIWANRVSAGRSVYDALVATAEKRFRKGWGGRVNYTLSRTEDNIFGEGNATGGGSGFDALNSYDLDAEYGHSIVDAPHRLNISGIVELPFGTGKRWLNQGGVWSSLFGGWAVSAVGYYQSGFPLRIRQAVNNTGLFTAIQRPNVVLGVDPRHDGSTIENLDSYLNPTAWVAASPFTLGNEPQTDSRVRSPFRQNWDFAFQKSQRVGAANLTVRAELINAFDHPDLGSPSLVFGQRNFGRILTVFGFPRMLQFTLRLTW